MYLSDGHWSMLIQNVSVELVIRQARMVQEVPKYFDGGITDGSGTHRPVLTLG